jgi:hypothetical protein
VSKIAGRLEDDAMLERHGDTRELRPRSPDLLLKAWEEDYDFFRHRVVPGHVPGTEAGTIWGRIPASAAPAPVWARKLRREMRDVLSGHRRVEWLMGLRSFPASPSFPGPSCIDRGI